MRALFIQHDHVSPPGMVGERLEQRGYEICEHLVVPKERYHTPDVPWRDAHFTEYDVVVVMGASWSVYDDATIGTWIGHERAEVLAANEAGVPILGICFGGQLLSAALGGSAYKSQIPELGWVQVESSDETVVPAGQWLEWHYDRWTAPAGARELAANAATQQAYTIGRNLALQFHPEIDDASLAGWLGNGGDAEARRAGFDPDQLLEQTRANLPDVRARTHRLVDAFVDKIARSPHGKDLAEPA